MRTSPATGLAFPLPGPSARLLLLYVAAALLSAVVVRAMIGVGVLDVPGHRSAHHRPTPKGGGVGVMAAFLLGLPLADWLHGGGPDKPTVCLVGAAGLIALFSWLDDLRQFPPILKLAVQAAAALLVLAGLTPLPGRLPGLLAGFGWLMFVTNALNFIDGLNGLAAGSMALCCLFIGAGAPGTGLGALERSAAWLLAAGLLGFLPFNMPRGRIFLGDVGSQAAGLMVASLGLLHWRDALPGSAWAAPLLLGGILYDVTFTLCRRLLRGERIWQAHRGHLYQVAFRSGIPASRVAVLHWGFVVWGAALAALVGRTALPGDLAIGLAMLPQLGWTAVVVRRASQAGLQHW